MRPQRQILAGLLAASVAAASWFIPAGAQAAASDLIISEYVEGSGNNKYLELHNGTGNPVDLGQYRLELYVNGKTTVQSTLNLSGTLEAGQTYVIGNAQASAGAKTDITHAVTNFNGDDAIVLRKGDAVVDSFGQVGVQKKWAENVTLVREPGITAGDTVIDDEFDPAKEWMAYPADTVEHLGSHTMNDSNDPEPTDPAPEPTPDPTPDPTDPAQPGDECKADATAIGEVQGNGDATPLAGKEVTIQGTVVGDFQEGGFNGYYLQDAGDGDDATSDGIFVYDRNKAAGDVKPGDVVRVTGTANEYYKMTQVSATKAQACGTAELPEPTVVDFPNTEFEPYEGMLVTFAKPLTVLELYQYGRYGQIAVGPERQYQPTARHEASSADARAELEKNRTNRVLIDDGRSTQNPSPAIHPATLEPLTMDTLFRGGDQIEGLAGVLDYRFDNWAIQPTQPGTITAKNPRPDVPKVGGDLKVGSANVLNYFTTLSSQDKNARGAETKEEFQRQEAKIVASLNKMDAAVIGLNEIENNGTAVQTLVEALNDASEPGKWKALETGKIGTDAITTALIYQPKLVEPKGDFDTLTSADDARFIDTKNRPTLAQTFTHLASGETITVAVNHLKSKGSACGDPSEATLQPLVGNCQETRVKAVQAMTDWLTGDTIGVEKSDNILVIGDMNSYDHEDPILEFGKADFTDMVPAKQGERAYSYVFDGQLGSLDHALANKALEPKVVDAAEWHTNADELPLIDYTMKYKGDAEDALFGPDAYRSSDHDPVLVGIQLGEKDEDPSDPDPSDPSDPGDDDPAKPAPTTFRVAPKSMVGTHSNAWGKVDGSATVRTQVRLRDGSWSTSQVRKTDANGQYVIPLTYGRHARGTLAWRVVVDHADGTREVTKLMTQTRYVRPTAASAGQAPTGRLARVWGVTDRQRGAKVWTEVQVNGRWSRSQVSKADASTFYAIELTYGKRNRGTYRWRVGAEYPGIGTVYSDAFTFVRR